MPKKFGKNPFKDLFKSIAKRDADLDGVPNASDCRPFVPFKDKKWIGEAVGEEGRVEEYLERVYGPEAFTQDGDIKITYINRAIKRIKNRHPAGVPKGSDDYSLMMALILARRLKRMG